MGEGVMKTVIEKEFHKGYSKGFEDGIICMNKHIEELIKEIKQEGLE